MNKFKVGDLVKTNKECMWYYDTRGLIGRIVYASDKLYGIDFGSKCYGHNLDGEITTNTGLFLHEYGLERAKGGNTSVY